MKPKRPSFLSFPTLALAGVISLSASAMAAVNNWNTTTGTWDTSTANWLSPTTWTNGNDAVFSNTATASTITLSSGLTAGSVVVGNGGNNANYTFTGGALSAASFTVQGASGNDPSTIGYPVTTLNNTTLDISGNIGVGRATLVIEGSSSIVTADTIGVSTGSKDWGIVTINDGLVTAKNGIAGSTTAWGLNLNGGTLVTKNLWAAPWNGVTYLNLNGTWIKPYENNTNFITMGGNGAAPQIGANGAKFDTDGKNIGIQLGMAGVGGLTKKGDGTLTLSGGSSYTGGTTINGGTLAIASFQAVAGGNSALGKADPTNIITINSGGVLTGSTYHNWLDETKLASGGTNAHAVVVNANGLLKGGAGYITGLGNVTLNGGKIEVSNGYVYGSWNGSFTLGGDITVGGTATTASYITTASGATGGSANMQMSNGLNDVGGTRTFTVNDVTSSAASDLIVSARLANGTVIKAGAGTLELAAGATGTGTAVSWTVSNGTLKISDATAAGAITNNAAVVFDTTSTQSFGNAISGTGALTKSGVGTLTLSGANNYSGGTTISTGVLSITGTGSLPGWDTNTKYSVASGATLAVGNAVTDANIATMLGTTNFAAGSSIGFDTTSGDRTYSTAIANTNQGALGLTKIGANTLNLSAPSTYTGGTTVSGGVLSLKYDSTYQPNTPIGQKISTNTVTINNGGTLCRRLSKSGFNCLSKSGQVSQIFQAA